MKTTAIILARGGSKGIPGKNIKLFAEKPLIAWTIEAAKKSKFIDRIIVSTDDQKIADVALEYGAEVPFMRPSELSTDTATSVDAVVHLLKHIPCINNFVLLQPTSPLRTIEDIDDFLTFCMKKNASSAVSICEAPRHPKMHLEISKDGYVSPYIDDHIKVTRRQDYTMTYIPNGALYYVDVSWFLDKKTFISSDTYGFQMPVDRSLDLDTMLDWKIAEFLKLNQQD